MFGIKIISSKRYEHLVDIEQNHEVYKQEMLNDLERIEKDLDSLHEQLSEKMMENNKLYDQVRELASTKPSFRKSTTKSRKKEP
jgi:hypothetical protein